MPGYGAWTGVGSGKTWSAFVSVVDVAASDLVAHQNIAGVTAGDIGEVKVEIVTDGSRQYRTG